MEWISAKSEHKPIIEGNRFNCLIATKTGWVSTGRYNEKINSWQDDDFNVCEIDWWFQIPKLPNQ